MHYAQGLTDQQEAIAMGMSIDWKFVFLRGLAHGDIPGAARKN
jgi:hypothetical protein